MICGNSKINTIKRILSIITHSPIHISIQVVAIDKKFVIILPNKQNCLYQH